MTSNLWARDLTFQRAAFLSSDNKRQLSGALFPGRGFWPGEDEQHPF